MTEENKTAVETVLDTDSFIYVVTDKTRKSKEVEFKNLTVQLPNAKQTVLLEDLNYTIKPGERIILTGESGAGKTTTAKAMLGNWDTGSGYIVMPDGLKTLAISQHINLSNTDIRGILNLKPAGEYIFSDRQLRDALLKVGLPQLVQHIPGQQEEILCDQLVSEARILAETEKDIDVIKQNILDRAGELASREFDYVQHVPRRQRAYIARQFLEFFDETFGENAPERQQVLDFASQLADKIDLTLAQVVVKGMQPSVKQAAYYNTRGRIFWPRLPLDSFKASYFNWCVKRSLSHRFNSYINNNDTEDPLREIKINELQKDFIAAKLTESVSHEVTSKYTRNGILSRLFNAVTWPLHLMTLPLRALRTGKEMTQQLAIFMDKQIIKGDRMATQLSGGQLKKLMLARTLLHKPDLLVLDEIDTGIDPEAKRGLLKEVLDTIPAETSVLSISHDLGMIDLYTTHAHLQDKKMTFKPITPAPKGP